MSDLKKAKMTGWYDPGQLARTGIQVAISTIFGRHADRRQLQALAREGEPPAKPFYNAPAVNENGEFWFDYIADVGDGFNSTYTMACHITEPTLELDGEATQQGQILIFGGDEVYPIASQQNYKERLIDPYNAAFSGPRPGQIQPEVYAVPGNHDWYDSLAEFGFNFMEDHFGRTRQFCGWSSAQERSYFAIKLHAGWWLFGTDMQLGSALDSAQMRYFRNVVKNEMGPDDRIILCNAEPHWITSAMYRDDPEYDNRNMGFFEGHILEHKVAVHIAGDRHYYRRHEEVTDTFGKPIPPDSQSRIQKITAGGGGAFLHPTHNEKGVETIGKRHTYELRKSFPEPSDSARLGWRNWAFPFLNPKFGIVTAIAYILTAWAFIAPIGQYGISDFWPALKVVLHTPIGQPLAFFWLAAIFAGFLFFTDAHSKWYRWVAGPLHGVAHLAGVFFVSWTVSHHIDSIPGHSPANWTWWQIILGTFLIGLGGYVVSAFIMGVYLFISLNIFKRHHNEAFSAIKIEDYKNFVRFKIEKNGDLVIYPVGVKKVIRSWRDGGKDERKIVPVEIKEENRAVLIEKPIICKKPIRAAARQPLSDSEETPEV